jgi:YHS domain-containing protein
MLQLGNRQDGQLVSVLPVSGEDEPEGLQRSVVPAPSAKQVHCPVSGFAIDPRYFAEFEGRRIYFCGAYCRNLFLKEPRLYLAAYREGLTAASRSTAEAVSASRSRARPRRCSSEVGLQAVRTCSSCGAQPGEGR